MDDALGLDFFEDRRKEQEIRIAATFADFV